MAQKKSVRTDSAAHIDVSKQRSVRLNCSALPVLSVVIAALLLVLVTVIVVIALGYRYTSDGDIRFIGKERDGVPWSGQMKYPSGETAKLDRSHNTIRYDDGSKYVGDIVNLRRSGKGVMTFRDGSRYEGDWRDDRIDGQGTFYYENGDLYSGSFRAGKFDGSGVFSWSNGDVYRGAYANDLRDGYGEFIWANGDSYTGYYKKDARNGQGTLIISLSGEESERYEGSWVDDKKQGEGVLNYRNGDRYSGNFVNGLPDTRMLDESGDPVKMENGEYLHGPEAIYTYADGRQYTGYFEEGKSVVKDSGE